MRDSESAPTIPQFQSPSTADLVPRLLRSMSTGKTQPTQQVTSAAGVEQTGVTPVKWMSKQKASAIEHFTKLTHRGKTPTQVGAATANGVDPAEPSSQTLHAVQTPIDTQSNDGNVGSVVADDLGQSPEPVAPSTLAKRVQDMLSAIPSLTPTIGSGSSQPTPPAPSQAEADDSPSSVRDPHPLAFLTLPNSENGPGSVVADDPGQSPDPVAPSTFAKRVQDMLSAIPSFPPSIGSGSSQPTTPAPSQTEVDDAPSSVRDPHPLAFLTLPNFENGPFEHGRQSFWSALDRFRLPYGKKTETESAPEPSQDDILDCIDDNNSVMMYGPLEPDDTSEVEIACSEIVSINGDGEEIRTPQPSYIPLPSESFDDDVMSSGGRSPRTRFIPLPLESLDEVLTRSGGRSPRSRFVSLPLESINEALMRSGGRSPRARFVPLPSESIDQVLMGGGGESSVRGTEGESEVVFGATGAAQVPPTTEPAADHPPVKEYRVWLPSLTKISVQTMWWGFRIYLPPPVLDVLNNKQLEAAKRAALITTALRWLMDHLPVALLPPQMRPGVTILRHLVPYVGYIGGFIAWTWSAIRSFDKGYGVVLTATWLLPFVLVPGTWEVEEIPTQNTDAQPSPSVSS